MPGRLKRIFSIAELAALESPVEATLSVTELPRFVEALGVDQRDDATVECRLNVQSESSRKVRIHGELRARVLTQCQRCLEGLELDLAVPVDWHLPDDMRIDDGHNVSDIEIRLLDWIEDELQLGIPLFAKHADAQCGGELIDKYVADAQESIPDTVTPFEGLKDLLSK